jgi:adenylate kinase family enzyme
VLLGPDDRLPLRPRRVLVAGGSGSGKSTLARRLARQLDLPYTEIDSLYHGPDWTPRETFLQDVRAVAAGERWASEWQYDAARPVLLARCDLMVWLDLPRALTTWRVVRRTVRRRVRREELWNGNREGPLRHVLRDPEHIIRWAWSAHPRAAERMGVILHQRPELPVVRLRSASEMDRWLRSVSADSGGPGRPR